jgi:hypothetical protein
MERTHLRARSPRRRPACVFRKPKRERNGDGVRREARET